MSTRSILKNRRNWFKLQLRHDPNNESAKKVVDEINFILTVLKDYKDENKKRDSE